jgi:hypothetical protein
MSKLNVDEISDVDNTGPVTITDGLIVSSGGIVSSGSAVLTSASTANFPAGSVLQVVSYLTATQGSQTITTTDQIINSITKVITPLGANSKFLVTVRWFGEISSAWNVPFNIHMDGVRVNINGQGRGYGLVMAAQSYSVVENDASTPETVNMSTLVSTSSVVGTAITFSLVADANNSTYTLWNNRSFNGAVGANEAGTSELIITEIGG